MQYILSEQEYKELVNARKNAQNDARADLQKVCTLAAKHTPVTVSWMSKNEPEPWGCILDEESDPGYCDHCPVMHICPYEGKELSK